MTGAARAAGVALIDLEGPIGPATGLYHEYASHQAEAQQAGLILLRIDTPGGLEQPMREIIKRILASPIPVVAYVAPSGARAASAGTYLLYASHVAAMAPATNVGAATPIPVMGGSAPPERERGPGRPDGSPADGDEGKGRPPASGAPSGKETAPPGDAASRKAVNDATAYLRSLAERRGRNADWAEQAVREGASLSAEAALRLRVIDIVATDTGDLLAQLDGRRIPWQGGERVLATRGLVVHPIPPTWRHRFLGVLTNPAVAYLLMLVGIYGLLLEGYSPGAILPGVTGAISLLLALYAFQLLPVNYAGLALLALGITLIVAETFVASVGILGGGGVIAFTIGSILLLDSDTPGYAVPIGLIAGMAVAASLLMAFSLSLLMRSRRRPVLQEQAGLAGASAVALEDFTGEGWVMVIGEHWRARSGAPVRKGQPLRVVRVDGLHVVVEPAPGLPSGPPAGSRP
jgi:membrane-bound serine protease (ClpP class)